jgi:hypothetical protein
MMKKGNTPPKRAILGWKPLACHGMQRRDEIASSARCCKNATRRFASTAVVGHVFYADAICARRHDENTC